MNLPSTPFVTPEWLAAHITTANLVLLDATLPPVGVTPPPDVHIRYLAQHLPGALYFDIDALSDHTSPYPHTLPSANSFGEKMSALGISETDTIVVYEQAGVFSAPRARWMLRTLGAQIVYLLDRDLPAAIAAGLVTESGAPTRPSATFHATLDRTAVKDFTELQQTLVAHEQILDARSSGRFHSTAPEPRPGLSSGHMPGATSLPFTELVSDGRLKSEAQLRELFASKSIDLTQPVTTTCGSGVTAAVLSLGLEIAGAKQVRLYDGSWAEYAQQPSAVIEKTP